MPQLRRTEDARLVSPNGDDIPLYLADPPAQLSTRVKRDLSPKVTDSQGVGYQNADERWLVFEQSDWSGGAGADKVRQEYGSETRYASAQGVITWVAGEVSPLHACDTMPGVALPSAPGGGVQRNERMVGVDYTGVVPMTWLRPLDPNIREGASMPPATVIGMSLTPGFYDLNTMSDPLTLPTLLPANQTIGNVATFQDHFVYPIERTGLRVVHYRAAPGSDRVGPNYQIPDPDNVGQMLDQSYYLQDDAYPRFSHCFNGVNANGEPVLIYTDGINYRQANQTDDTIDDVDGTRTWPDWQFSEPVRIGPADYLPDVHDMLMFKGRLMVGRSDGLWVYDLDDAKFVNIEPQVGFRNDRFTHLTASGNELYATYGNTQLVRIVDPLGDAPEFYDVTSRIQHAHWRGVTGAIRGLAAWRGYILVVADGYGPEVTQLEGQDISTAIPLESSFASGHARLMLYDPSTDTGHILHQFEMEYVHGMLIENTYGYVYVYGWNSDENSGRYTRYRYRPAETQPYPTLIDNPDWTFPDGSAVDEDNPAYYHDGWVTTPWIDHSYIDDTKTLDHVRVVYSTQTATGGVKVEYRTEQVGELLEGANDFVGESQEFVDNAESFTEKVGEFLEGVTEFASDVRQRTAALTDITDEEREQITETLEEFEDDVADFNTDTVNFQTRAATFVEEGGRFATATRQVSSNAPDTHPHSWIPLGVLTRGRQELRIPKRDNRLRYSRIRFRFTLIGMTKMEQVVIVSRLDRRNEREFSLGLSFRDTPNDVRPEKTLRKLEEWRKRREQYRFVPVSNSLAWLDEATVEITDLEIQTGSDPNVDGTSPGQLGADAILRLEEVTQ